MIDQVLQRQREDGGNINLKKTDVWSFQLWAGAMCCEAFYTRSGQNIRLVGQNGFLNATEWPQQERIDWEFWWAASQEENMNQDV